MNDRAGPPQALPSRRSPADLAHEPDFRLGRTQVRPSILQVQPEGQAAQALEPRVMQVLVVLARAEGEVVSRGDLIERCWEGRVVGDNAINRVVSRLRQLALADGGDFEIETIARVGYRLKAAAVPTAELAAAIGLPADVARQSPARMQAQPESRPMVSQPPVRRRWLQAALAAGLAAGLGVAGWFAGRRSGRAAGAPGGARLAVLPFATPPEQGGERLLGVGMADSLITRLSGVHGLLVRPGSSAVPHPGPQPDPVAAARELGVDWVVDGSLLLSGERLQTTARLLRASDGATVWSASFDTPVDGIFDVQDLISARVARALAAALD